MASEQQWKDKYLDLIDENEQQRLRFEDQQALLRRAIGRLGIAAEGVDDNLDHLLLDLRGLLRKNSSVSLAPILNKIDDAVVHADDNRSDRVRQCLKGLVRVSEQLQAISKDKEADKALKQYRNGLKQRADRQQEYGQLLTELADLQADVIASVSQDSSNFWAKLTGKKEIQLDEPEAEARDELASESAAEAVEQTGAGTYNTSHAEPQQQRTPAAEPAQPMEGQFLSRAEVDQELEATLDKPRHEPAFSRISNHISRVLTELLEGIEAESCVQDKAIKAKLRIAKGLNWFELVPTLEDIRDLIFQAYLAAEHNFQEYLNGVDKELKEIADVLGLALVSQEQKQLANDALHQEMGSHLDELGTSVANISDIDQLKSEVSDHLGQIQEALQSHKADTGDVGLFQQLQQLLGQVQEMEVKAEQHEAELAEQKHKAQTDPLTGLPNREAYTERAFLEQERCKRYGHLLIVAVCDVDNFKAFNDNYGHQTGDRVLKLIAKAVGQRIRKVDFMARYGGEEFVLLLPETDMDNAIVLMDKIRESLASAPLRFKDKPVQITVSVGLAEFAEGDSIDKVFARADQALYKAKADGRNCCRKFEPSTDTGTIDKTEVGTPEL